MSTIKQQAMARSHTQLKVELPARLHQDIKLAALSRGQSMRKFVELTLEREVKQEPAREVPLARLLPLAPVALLGQRASPKAPGGKCDLVRIPLSSVEPPGFQRPSVRWL